MTRIAFQWNVYRPPAVAIFLGGCLFRGCLHRGCLLEGSLSGGVCQGGVHLGVSAQRGLPGQGAVCQKPHPCRHMYDNVNTKASTFHISLDCFLKGDTTDDLGLQSICWERLLLFPV